MLSDFHKSYENFSATLKTAFENNEINTIKKMIHTIKGTSGTIGAMDLMAISENLDKRLKQNLLDDLDVQIDTLNNALKIVLDSINQWIKSDTSDKKPIAPKNTLTIEIIVSALKEIESLLSKACLDASEDLLDTIKDDLILLGFKEEVQELTEKIDDFEYTEAREITKDLINNLKMENDI